MGPLDARIRMAHHELSWGAYAARGPGLPRSIPTVEATAPWSLGMVCLMRRLLILCGILLTSQPSLALEPALLAGTWVGSHDGQSVVWQVMDAGRLRVDGRPADFEIHADSLVIRFDPPLQANADPGCREVAVYRFVASTPQNGTARLFVSGFDLGKQGALLLREPAEQSDPGGSEDAAPPAPSHTSKPVQQRTAAIPGPGNGSRH
jgi:hypothetical protein